MKNKVLKWNLLIFPIFLIFGCNDCSDCNKNLIERNTELSNLEKDFNNSQIELEDVKKRLFNISTTSNKYVPKQSQRELTTEEKIMFKERHFDTEGISGNSFDTNMNDGEIYLNFPIYNPPNKTNEIVDVLNVSTKDINAIVVLLNKVDGAITRKYDTSHFLTTTIKMDKVGLCKSNLAKHKKLKVYVFHDDAFYIDGLLNDFKGCVAAMGTIYDINPCGLPDVLTALFGEKKPREQEGDIIIGG
ncbi:hypothetical protein [Winogradskyella helgolandensis]|uniref:hypothetical protein n=1 Tax=Winogradskyella helgolandensis TaxID=2697010 RepID=UPI0015C86FA9|nr:hypothetical protein [Winogradskyella helgolandensis]